MILDLKNTFPKEKVEVTMSAPITEAENLGKSVGEDLLNRAGVDILRSIEQNRPIFIRPHPDAN